MENSQNEISNKFIAEYVEKELDNKDLSFLGALSEILTRLDKISTTQEEDHQIIQRIDNKTDIILDLLRNLSREILDIKTENRDVDEKINLICSKLNNFENSKIESNELDEYIALAQDKYEYWDEYEDLTQKFLPVSEYLYSKLQRLKEENLDYSPVIIEVCRAIEYEFLRKIFNRYSIDLIARQSSGKISNFLYTDDSNNRCERDSRKKTDVFVKAIKQVAKFQVDIKCTLGSMNMILKMLKDTELVSRSPLLQDFQEYLKRNADFKKLLDINYVERIDDIVNRFRNRSAHPDIMDENAARECKDNMPENIDYLIECLLHCG